MSKSSPAAERRRLQADHADDHGEVVLHPVLDLARAQRRTGASSRPRRRRCRAPLRPERNTSPGPRRRAAARSSAGSRTRVPSARWLVMSTVMSSPLGDGAAQPVVACRARCRGPAGSGSCARARSRADSRRQPRRPGWRRRSGCRRCAGSVRTQREGRPRQRVDGRTARAAAPIPLAHRVAWRAQAARTVRCSMRFSCWPCRMRCTKMPGVWMPSGSSEPSGTISSTSAMQTLPQVAAFGLKFRAVLR